MLVALQNTKRNQVAPASETYPQLIVIMTTETIINRVKIIMRRF